jgi:hypothetical protein
MNNLALTYRDLSRTNEAAALLEKVLDALTRTLGDDEEDPLI